MGDGSVSRADDDDKATSGLQRIVWFRQMIHRWQYSSSTSTTTKGPSISSGDGDRANDDPAGASADGDTGCDRDPLLPGVMVVVEERDPAHVDDDAAEGGSPMTTEGGGTPMTPATPGDLPADVPRGCCPVYVGTERRRFVVPTAYLGMPVFRRLLEKAEEEFEFHYHGGALTIPCDTEAFKYILLVMDRHRHGLVDDEGNAKHDDGEQGGSSSQSQAR